MGKIQNIGILGSTPLRKAALSIAEAGLAAIDTEVNIRGGIRLEGNTLAVRDKTFSLDAEGKLIVIGVGKCALEAGRALEAIIGDRMDRGVILIPDTSSTLEIRNSKLEIFVGTHPFPTRANMDATRAIINLLDGLSAHDTVLFVISGGGSVLLCEPANHTCEDEANILRRLFEVGADIREINTLRKHLSRARGGWLARYAYPAQVVSLVFSDIPDGEIESVASGPTVRDQSTIADARMIMEKYDMVGACRLPNLKLVETPKEEKFFERVTNILFVSNETALRAMAAQAEREGFASHIVSNAFVGEAAACGAAIAHALHETPPKTALLYGGETTVTLNDAARFRSVEPWRGKGGRNMELALAALPEIRDGELVLALASDGRDNSDFAGALCDTMTKVRAEEEKLDPQKALATHDSYPFFESAGGALVTGPTGSNVADLIIALKNN